LIRLNSTVDIVKVTFTDNFQLLLYNYFHEIWMVNNVMLVQLLYVPCCIIQESLMSV